MTRLPTSPSLDVSAANSNLYSQRSTHGGAFMDALRSAGPGLYLIASGVGGGKNHALTQYLRELGRGPRRVFVAGEIRDRELMQVALQCAEHGEHVLATVTAASVPAAVARLRFFVGADPTEGRLETQLKAVLHHRLVKDWPGRLDALPVLLSDLQRFSSSADFGPELDKHEIQGCYGDLASRVASGQIDPRYLNPDWTYQAAPPTAEEAGRLYTKLMQDLGY